MLIFITILTILTIYFLGLVSLELTDRVSCIGNQFSRICDVAWRNDKDNKTGSDTGRPESTRRRINVDSVWLQGN